MGCGHLRRCRTGPLLGALTALGACWGGPWARATELTEPVLDLVWVDLAAVGPALMMDASAEVRDLLSPLGVRVTSRVEAPGLGYPPSDATVLLARRIPNGARPARSGQFVAGSAALGNGSHNVWVLPAPVADCLNLALERRPLWTYLQRREFAHALAVVVAHELAHSLAGAVHAPAGLMAKTLRPGRLRDRHLGMDARLAPHFRAALTAPPPPEP